MILYYIIVTFFEWGIAYFERAIALRRYKGLCSATSRIGHCARDHPLAVLGNGSRIHDEVGRRV
jgi:hypothetical protein